MTNVIVSLKNRSHFLQNLLKIFFGSKVILNGTVEPLNSELQNSVKPRISEKFSNDQIITFELLNLQKSDKHRNSGIILGDQTFRYCGVLLY